MANTVVSQSCENDSNDDDAGVNPGSGVACNFDDSCSVPADDVSCGTIDCDGLDNYVQSGTESATATETCTFNNYADITSNRCEGYNDCKDANTADCSSPSSSTSYTCGTCQFISASSCTGTTAGSCSDYDAGTSCGSGLQCNGAGSCKKVTGQTCSSGSECLSGICYKDTDGDRYAPSSGTKTCQSSAQLGGTDCDDNCVNCFPGSTAWTATADGKDQDCDGTSDENEALSALLCAGPWDVGKSRVEASCNAYCGSAGGTVTCSVLQPEIYTGWDDYDIETCTASNPGSGSLNACRWWGSKACDCNPVFR